ncbi:hypothetical protein [Paenibacillus sp. FJAT-26967]|uniref:hypothetical protein n=1 Tax=Paenibacillus sp. FJAT-26967 TaxID=1729690 RepID=UPI000A827B54|nr:hypothetical protein [Paenibacillus sp. FJAT-26967]
MERTMQQKQSGLFPAANEQEIQRTKFLLEKYKSMILLMEDFEKYEKDLAMVGVDGEAARRIDQDELYSDKTANAVILMEKQRWVYQQYTLYTTMLYRAFGLIRDPEAKEVIKRRYIEGCSYTETILFFRRAALSDSTIRRKMTEGMVNMANHLKLIGFFEQDNAEF